MSDSDRYVAALAELAAVTKERDEARAERDGAIQVRNERWARHKENNARLLVVEAERDRLRAALEETVENHQLIIAAWADGGPRGVLAAIRARAGLT
jgi:hypothetical protein